MTADREVLRTPECRGFMWMGQSLAHCDNCGRDIREHDGFAMSRGGPFSGEWETVPFTEAMERIPLFAHCATPRQGYPHHPYRWQRADELPLISWKADADG